MTERRTPQPFGLGLRFSLDQPLSYEEAREAARVFAEQRQEARQMLESAYAELAQAEHDYRLERRRTRATAQGKTGKERDEHVDAETAGHRLERDRANFKVKLIGERLAEIDGTRASLHQLIAWSAKVDPDASHDRADEPTIERLQRAAA
ncbi:MAG: hypothetical protein ACRDK9_14020 [Solirubrobacterales bacterium]